MMSTFSEAITLTNTVDVGMARGGIIPASEVRSVTKSMEALVIPGADEVLFGALCREALDVMADPVGEHLVGRHGDKAVYRLK